MSEMSAKSESNRAYVDKFGAIASTACALHCAAVALVPTIFSLVGLELFAGHTTEWVLTGIAVIFGLFALFFGWRNHGNVMVLTLLTIGIVGLLAARTLEAGHDHGEHHHGEKAQAAHHEDAHEGHGSEHHDEHGEGHEGGDKHAEHDEKGALGGELFGILAGLFLVTGHIGNLMVDKRKSSSGADADCEQECC